AYLALVFRVGEIGIGLYVGGRGIALAADDDTGARREAEPIALGIAQVRGHARRQDRRGDRLQHAAGLGAPKIAGIDGDEHVGGRAFALDDEALKYLLTRRREDVDLDARLLREGVVEDLIAVVVAAGVDVDDLVRRGGVHKAKRHDDRSNEAAHPL